MPRCGIDAEAERGERIERGVLAGGEVLAVDKQEIGVEDEAALRDDARLKGAEGAGGGVARVDGWREPRASRSSLRRRKRLGA